MNVLLIEELIGILKKELEIYNRLLELGEDKTRIIVDGKVSELEAMTRTEQETAVKLSKLEASREGLVSRIAKEIGKASGDLTIAHIAEHCDSEAGKTLSALREDILEVVNRLRKLNEHNAGLLKNSLDYVQFSLNMIAGIGEEDNNYNMDGGKMTKKARNLFDRKI